MAGNHNFSIQRGARWSRQVTWVSQNITGYSASMKIYRNDGDATPLLELTTANSGIVLVTPASGIFSLNMTYTQTQSLQGNLFYTLNFDNGVPLEDLLAGRIFMVE